VVLTLQELGGLSGLRLVSLKVISTCYKDKDIRLDKWEDTALALLLNLFENYLEQPQEQYRNLPG
jgi:hypothetical protein